MTVWAFGRKQAVPELFIEGVPTGTASDDSGKAVADSILTLVQTPAGSRPLRTIVDPMMGGGGADAINQVSSEVQSQLLNNLGIGHVLPVQ